MAGIELPPASPQMNAVANLLTYLVIAGCGYGLFIGSQVMRLRYIELMAVPVARIVARVLEYIALLMAANCGWSLIQFEGAIYYGLDVMLLVVVVRAFLANERVQGAELVRVYQGTKQKAVNRMIVSLGKMIFGQDN